ncbi:MAG: hypothetical protein V1817_04020 [Candidatus Micrarchaeota archaeon]
MTLMRTTVTLEDFIVAKIRQMYGGNLSKGLNAVAFEHLFKERKRSGFGLLKGKNYLKDLEEIEKEDETELSELEKLRG